MWVLWFIAGFVSCFMIVCAVVCWALLTASTSWDDELSSIIRSDDER